MAFISNSIARMVFGAQHEETTGRTVASAVSGHTRSHSVAVSFRVDQRSQVYGI